MKVSVLSNRGIFLGEVLISLVVISSLLYITFTIFGSMTNSYSSQEKLSRAYYVASMKMEEILATNYDNITTTGCESISSYIGDNDYLNGNVCVEVNGVDWDGGNDIEAKSITVRVEF